jgi:hypothetical protein
MKTIGITAFTFIILLSPLEIGAGAQALPTTAVNSKVPIEGNLALKLQIPEMVLRNHIADPNPWNDSLTRSRSKGKIKPLSSPNHSLRGIRYAVQTLSERQEDVLIVYNY